MLYEKYSLSLNFILSISLKYKNIKKRVKLNKLFADVCIAVDNLARIHVPRLTVSLRQLAKENPRKAVEFINFAFTVPVVIRRNRLFRVLKSKSQTFLFFISNTFIKAISIAEHQIPVN